MFRLVRPGPQRTVDNQTVVRDTFALGDQEMIRKARFAHSWYPGDANLLRDDLADYMGESLLLEKASAVIAPHAGYTYSGPVAGALYSRVRIPDTVVVLCVNHRGIGARAAIMSSGFWETPLGQVRINKDLAGQLLDRLPLLIEDSAAHSKEHSLEMQIPFLQYRNPGFELVPICLQRLDYEECAELGKVIAQAVMECPEDVLLVASTDMTHFETQEDAEQQDRLAIDQILNIDPEGLYNTVERHRISMCGYIPATAVLSACRHLGSSRGELVRYGTSGDITRDYKSVVGYAGILIRQ